MTDSIEPLRQKGAAKTACIPVKVVPAVEPARKPAWIRVRSPGGPGCP
jgi:hypothetical protein